MSSSLQISLLSSVLFFSLSVHSNEISQISPHLQKQLNEEERLGMKIFFDTQLSDPPGQACASCHDPKTAYSDADDTLPVSKGIIPGRTGGRNTPSIVYSIYSPSFYFNTGEGLYLGGQFLDGRAATLQDQAKQPFLNPNEMNNADSASVMAKVANSEYSVLFKKIYGEAVFKDSAQAFDKLAAALAAFEKSAVFNRFTSKYDYYLAGLISLTSLEKRGLELFNAEDKGNCAACHPSLPTNKQAPLFTDFSYDNLGVPANESLLALNGNDFVDLGLGGVLGDAKENGKFKVPSLRNIAKTAPYFHNGVFNTLEEVVDFYNTRDVKKSWHAPEVVLNKNQDELGNLGLSDAQSEALVAFLRTLSDGFTPELPGFSTLTGILELPWLKIEQNEQEPFWIKARLQLISSSKTLRFKLLDWEKHRGRPQIENNGQASFSSTTGLLEIPNVRVLNQNDYLAQFKLIPAEPDMVFELQYYKAI